MKLPIKRILGLITALCLLVALTGCGEDLPKETTGPAEQTQGTQGTQSTQNTTLPTFSEPTVETTLPPPEANPYEPEDFVFDGNFLTCTARETSVGIDVSVHQGVIDWEKVAASGVDFVMIRAAYRGYKYGQIKMDDNALSNIQGAKAAGLKVGVYFFSQAINVREAWEEADFLLEMLEGIELDLPIAYDWEYVSAEARTANVDARTLTDCAEMFCETILAAKRQTMIYFNTNHAMERLFLEELTAYPFWLAQYDLSARFPYRMEIWQYSNTGKVNGIYGNVDLNVGFFTFPEQE